jgi:transcription initiation factor TFIIIB Brf1 subunit/transcription initiation factor TFIIB
MSGRACPNCGSTHIEQHGASGASVCTECGVVLEENAIVSSVEFAEGAGGASSMVGQFVSATSSKAYTGAPGGGGRYGFSRDSRETTLANGRRRIQEVASRLRLGGHYVDAAHRLFTIAVEKNFVQGRRTTHVVAACLYIACRQEKSQHMLIDFSDALQVNVYTLGTCFLKFRRLLGLKLEILDPALYVYRFAAHLDLDDKANAVALTALRLVGRMKRDWIVAGRRPAGICAAALLIAARAHGFSRHPQDVTRILRVCGLTVATRVKEFEHTSSARLTLDQFNKVELDAEADPPIFTKNRIMEARARAIQDNNLKLLTSGALDDPMAGKGAAKWRSGKMNEKHVQFELLYQDLEKEMIKQKNNMNSEGDKSEEKKDAEDMEEVEDGESKADEADTEAETEKEGKDDADASDNNDEKDVDEKEDSDGDGKPAAKGSKNGKKGKQQVKKQKLTDVTELANITASNQTQLANVHPQWAQAYPKSKHGKAIILADHSTPEERLPSTVPVEGLLDLKGWKEDLPSEVVDDVDSIFRSPEEIATKEAIFNKINKDYIVAQEQKEKNRKQANVNQTQAEKELEEQTAGHERYRKRKNRGADTAETTEEALLAAVANRKISRKINYDAMSTIFDEDGTFSTDGGGMFDDDGEV